MKLFQYNLNNSSAYLIRLLKNHWQIIIVCILFAVITIALSSNTELFLHQVNPDATSYFTIAKKYASLDFRHAINGYWSPILSWLLVPAVWINIDLALAARVINTIVGILIMLVIYQFLIKNRASKTLATGTSIILAIMLNKWILIGSISPDLLMALLIVVLCILALKFVDKPSKKMGILIGVIGALMYFTKGFGFYLFVAALALLALWRLIVTKNIKLILKQYLPVFLTFIVITLPFICAISYKYQRITINNAGTYNYLSFSPTLKGHYLANSAGPVAPLNDTAISNWEDPSVFIDMMPNWSPFESKKSLGYFLEKTWNNIVLTQEILIEMGTLITLGVIVMILACLGRQNRQTYVFFTIISIVQVLAYSLVFIEERYIWSIGILAITSLALWLNTMQRKKILTSLQLAIGFIILAALIIQPMPEKYMSYKKGTQNNLSRVNFTKKVIPSGSKIIADEFSAYYISYYNNYHQYGILETPAKTNEAAYYKRLKDLGIKYYVSYSTGHTSNERLAEFLNKYFKKIATTKKSVKEKPNDTTVEVFEIR